MKRNLQQLAEEVYDVLVIGGGIYGAAISRAAAKKGYKVALIEQADFGHATSANSQKIIHGGLRYLQHLNIQRMRESINARRRLLAFAPHLVKPMQFLIPTYGYGLRGRPVMALALALNDLIGWDRNRNSGAQPGLPGGGTVSKERCLEMIPGLDPATVTGGATWFDAMATNTERLTLTFVASAARHGAVVANYVRAEKYLSDGSKVGGVTASDQTGGQEFDIRAKLTVNASGPWSDELNNNTARNSDNKTLAWAKAMNIVIDRPLFDRYAVGLSAGAYVDNDAILSKGARDFFFVPWRNGTIIGTTYRMYSGKAENCNIHSDDITDMVDDINRAYPAAKITRKEICHVHFGLLPAQPAATGSSSDIQLLKNTIIADDPDSSGLRGLTSVTGVKYTTAGEVADKLIRQIAGQSGRPRRSQIEASDSFGDDDKRDDQPEPNNKSIDDKLNAMGLENKTIEHLQTQYRSEIGGILRHLETPERRRPLCPDRPHVEGEISYFVAEEMAQTLSDVLFRRTDIGTAGYPGNTVIRNCAAAMARACDWSEDRVRRELESTLRAYKALQNLGCGTSDSISVTAEAVMKHLEP